MVLGKAIRKAGVLTAKTAQIEYRSGNGRYPRVQTGELMKSIKPSFTGSTKGFGGAYYQSRARKTSEITGFAVCPHLRASTGKKPAVGYVLGYGFHPRGKGNRTQPYDDYVQRAFDRVRPKIMAMVRDGFENAVDFIPEK